MKPYQNFLSFIGGFFNELNLENYLKFLPSKITQGVLIKKNDFLFYFNHNNNNPLYDYLIYESDSALFFCSGFFYSEIDKDKLNNDFLYHTRPNNYLKIVVKSLNGSYNGFYLDTKSNKVFLFSDYLGYEKVYFSSINGKLIFSSFIWPLIDDNYELDKVSLSEHLIFGHTLGLKTLFKKIFLIKPGHSNELTKEGLYLGSEDLFHFDKKVLDEPEKLAKKFISKFSRNINFIKNKINSDNLISTLTGGGETRVIINSMLHANEKPICLTGSYPSLDIERAQMISKVLNLKNIVINYDDFLPLYKEQILDVVATSNGYTNGWWMSLISRESMKFGNHCYYGFSGDLIAGSMLFDVKKLTIDKLINLLFRYKTQYSVLNPEKILYLTHTNYSEVFENYVNTFENNYDNLTEVAFRQEKNEMNYKRIASFADGTRIGSIPIWPFHDIEIIEFYRSLTYEYLDNEKMHKYLANYQNKILQNISSAAKTNVNEKILYLLINLFGKNNLIKLNNFKVNIKYLFKPYKLPISFKEYVFSNIPYIPNNLPEFDWNAFEKIKNRIRISYKDYDLLTMRISDIFLSLYLIENRKKYNHNF